MLPYLYEFHWSAGHLVFLGVFGCVAATLAWCVALAAARAARVTRRPGPEATPSAPARNA